MVLFSGGVSLLSQRLLANAAYCTGLDDYAKIVTRTMGRQMSVMLDVIIFLYTFGSCIGYFVFMEQFGPYLTETANLPSWCSKPSNITVILAIFPVLPMCLMRYLSSLRYASLLSVLCLVIVALAICAMFPAMFQDLVNRPDKGFQRVGGGVLISVPGRISQAPLRTARTPSVAM